MDMNLHAAGGNVITLGSLDNPNKMPFQGVLTFLNVPSDEPPGGSGGLKVLIPEDIGRPALDSLKGMPVNLAASMDDHDTDAVVGIIENAWIGEETTKGIPVYISGHIFAKSFPEEAAAIKASQKSLGFSYETAKTKLEMGIHNGETVAVAKSLVFTGAAILFKDAAAYHSTSLAAKKEPNNSEVNDQVAKEQTATEALENEVTPEATETQAEEIEVTASEETAEEIQAAEGDKKSEEETEDEESEEPGEGEESEDEDKKEKDGLKASIDKLTALVTQLTADVAELKAAKAETHEEVTEEVEEEETEVEAAAGDEPQRRSAEASLVSKFEGSEEDGDITASIDKKNLKTVDSMAMKLSAYFPFHK